MAKATEQDKPIAMLDLGPQVQALESELMDAMAGVVRSTQFVLGPRVAELESRIADYAGTKHAIGVSSGTDALLVALMALDVGPGDIVVTTPYSFFATAGAVVRLGATAAFVDIDPDTYNICPEALAEWFDKNPSKVSSVKAVIPDHLFGQCAEMDPIMEIAGKHGVAVIEDAAQAIGAKYPGAGGVRSAGSMGGFGCFSFFPSKNLGAFGDAGMVVTNDGALAGKVRVLRVHGSKPKYYHRVIGGNFRIDELQAAVLLVKLPHLDTWHAARRERAERYDALFADIPIAIPKLAHGRAHHIYNQYVISVGERRDELMDFLGEAGISTSIFYPVSFHEQECFAPLRYRVGDFPHAEHAARHTLALPIHPDLSAEDQARVAARIGAFYG